MSARWRPREKSALYVQVDAFTDQPFHGNPAAIFVTAEACDEAWMQMVAREMNLSETAFVHPLDDGFRLRWFTPTTEVDLCGHATLASAHVLWDEGHLNPQTAARFHTRSGILGATLDGEWIWLDFPVTPVAPVEEPAALIEALGTEPTFVGQTPFDYLAELPTEKAVTTLEPDFAAIGRLHTRGVIVTALAQEHDFVSRYFAPGYGIPEDPVTGSAHCALGDYWQTKLGRSEFTAYQASPRGGIVRVAGKHDRKSCSTYSGQAVTTVTGCFLA